MTETVLRPSQLDTFVRERVETIILSSCSNSSRTLHIPTNPDADREDLETVCTVHSKSKGWVDKQLAVYPPGYYPICPKCVTKRFGIEVIDE